MLKILCFLFMFLLFFSNCQTNRYINYDNEDDVKIAVYGENEWNFLKNYFTYRGYDVEMIFSGNFLIFKNINEDVIMDILMLLELKLNIIADNIANVNTTKTNEGGVFRRSFLAISAESGIEIQRDYITETRLVYDPTHPDSIVSGRLEGYVEMPNVDVVTEMVKMIVVQRLYERILEYAKLRFKNIIW